MLDHSGEMPRQRVLIVEDETIIALLLEQMLENAGFEVVLTARSLPEAIAAAQECDVDAAVLDINLRGQMSYPAAHLLAERGIPFIFVTGYASKDIPPGLGNVPVLQKPYRSNDLIDTLASVSIR